MQYKFDSPLKEALILSRPNRFIMIVNVDGSVEKCHCPATGRIGGINFENIPCLLSEGKGIERKTKYTVEAISLDLPETKDKKWIGINQTAANRYIEFFLKTGNLSKIVGNEKDVKREVRLGKSRIDFLVGNKYLEVKTPLTTLPSREHLKYANHTKFDSFDRLIKHFRDLAKSLKNSKAVLLMCYLYDAEPFKPPATDKYNKRIKEAAKKAMSKGIENWQINLKVDKHGVKLVKYFKLYLF